MKATRVSVDHSRRVYLLAEHITAVRDDGFAGHIRGGVGREKDRHLGDLSWFAPPSERHACQTAVTFVIRVRGLPGHPRMRPPGRKAQRTDAVRAPLNGRSPRQLRNRRFGSRVDAAALGAGERGLRADRNDHAALLLYHASADELHKVQRTDEIDADQSLDVVY